MPESPPRLLHITRNLPPLVGGMERLNWHMAEELAREYEVHIIGPAGSAVRAPDGIAVAETPLRPLWRFLLVGAWRAVRIARLWKPNVVLAGSGLTAPLVWLAARLCGARAAAYLHGLDIAVRHPVYRLLWLPSIRRMDIILVNSCATRNLAIEHGILESSIVLIPPGVDLPDDNGTADEAAARDFRRAYGLGCSPILLSVGRLTARKGLREFIRDVLPQVAAEHPDVQLVVVGDTAGDALGGTAQTREDILRTAQSRSVDRHVTFVGRVSDVQLSSAYRAASLHVFPVRELPGDPEGFGMVAIEAAAHGLPTAAYATGGIGDAVSDGISGRLAPPGNADALACHILDLLATPLPDAPMRTFAAQFAWPRFGERLRAVLRGTER